ncbi:MAG: hypothetical protein IT320_20110 [Anaerolineae bacterium]|nr:hypothetical protein [Anaerolineae bacterium]
MPDILVQFVGLVALIVGVSLSYLRWVRRREPLGWSQRTLLLVLITVLVGGIIGATGWWADDPRSFSWDLPPLASRMLGAAAIAFAPVCVAALEQPVYGRIRLALIMIVVYLLPLALAILAFHMDRFDFSAPLTYSFFIVVAGLTLLSLWFLYRQPILQAETAADRQPTSPIVRTWLWIVALITLVWGAALMIADTGPITAMWPWPGDLLTSRLIGTMLLTLAAASAYSAANRARAGITLVTLLVYGLLVALANVWNSFAGRPVNAVYVSAFAVMAVVSVVLLFRYAHPREAAAT